MASNSSATNFRAPQTTQLLLVSLLKKQHPSRFSQLTSSDIQGFFTHWFPTTDLWEWIANRFSVEDIKLVWQQQMGKAPPQESDMVNFVVTAQRKEQELREQIRKKAGQASKDVYEKNRRKNVKWEIERLECSVKDRLKQECYDSD
ncbi:MAG: hypothetical protein L6R37_007252 [Teloschistes peruensis]|nr:MAG: hypothetical protein L6R37_007252 [Teloschistes peruensis]